MGATERTKVGRVGLAPPFYLISGILVGQAQPYVSERKKASETDGFLRLTDFSAAFALPLRGKLTSVEMTYTN